MKPESKPSPAELLDFLQSHFKKAEFRGAQLEALRELLQDQPKSGFAVMPTGAGKSLIYQFFALWRREKVNAGEMVIVLSPLVALMQDQVREAQLVGLQAACLNHTQSKDLRDGILRRLLERRDIDVLFVTPERFRQTSFVEVVHELKVSLLVIDEAHCISQWGHDFRPEYGRINLIQQTLKQPLTLALTATATPQVRKDICRQLSIEESQIWVHSVQRPELHLNVHSVYGLDEKVRLGFALRMHHPGPAIFYFSLISQLYKYSEELQALGVPHLMYHGDLSSQDRKAVQNEFMNSKDRLLLATPAFGLGLNKADIRLLVHLEIPGSIEAYFQEVGRAGRDGQSAQAHLLFDQDDLSIQQDFIKWAHPDLEFVRTVVAKLKARSPMLVKDLKDQMLFYHSRDYRLETVLNWLEREGSIQTGWANKAGAHFVQEPSPEFFAALDVTLHKKDQSQKLYQILQWAGNEVDCRMVQIYSYFGEQSKPCGNCDNCLKKK